MANEQLPTKTNIAESSSMKRRKFEDESDIFRVGLAPSNFLSTFFVLAKQSIIINKSSEAHLFSIISAGKMKSKLAGSSICL